LLKVEDEKEVKLIILLLVWGAGRRRDGGARRIVLCGSLFVWAWMPFALIFPSFWTSKTNHIKPPAMDQVRLYLCITNFINIYAFQHMK